MAAPWYAPLVGLFCGGVAASEEEDPSSSDPSSSDAWTGSVPKGYEWMVAPEDLPYATTTPGIAGRVKARCAHFSVTELIGEPADGVVHRGAFHYWLLVRRSGLTTESCQRILGGAFGLSSFRDVGVCGRKDKVAVATQWFSVPCRVGKGGFTVTSLFEC